MEFYVVSNGETQGPYSVEQIKGYLNMGQLQYADMAWYEGLPEWKPLSEFPEFPQRAYRTPNYKAMTFAQTETQVVRQSKWPSIVFGLVIVAVAAGAGYYFWNKKQQKEKEVAAAPAAPAEQVAQAETPKKELTPQTLAELNKWYEEPAAGQNAATFFQQGFAALQVADTDKNSSSLPLFGRATAPPIGTPVSASMKTAINGFMERNKPALDLFLQAAKCEGSRYPADLTQAANTPLPHLAKVKQAALLGELQVLDQAGKGQGDGAAQGVLVALAAGRSLAAEPLLISQLVRVACQGVAMEALEQSLNRVALPAEALTRLQEAFNRAADDEASGTCFNRALVGERTLSLSAFELPPDQLKQRLSGGATPGKTAAAVSDKAISSLKDQRQYFEETINQFLDARKEALPGRLKADDTITPRYIEAQGKGYGVCTALLPAVAKTTTKEAVSLARMHLAQTAVALARYHAANTNKYPDSLNELSPKFLSSAPNDPFDGQSLRYRKAGVGFLLYSIGPDLRDDGGVRKAGSDDLSFIIVTAPKP